MSMPPSLSVLVCGDVCPTPDTRPIFDNGGHSKTVFGSLAPRVAVADLAIANLECVLSETALAVEKIGPVLRARPADAAMLRQAGFDLVGLANNHIGDCGPEGVIDTLAACAAAGLSTTGAGADIDAAAQPIVIERKGWRVAVMAVAEHEFNAAGPSSAGAHIFDPLVDLERIRQLKSACDYVIVLYHGGIEYHPYPSPLLQRTCRALVNSGADLVLCQHSHVIGTYEVFNNGYILYGQGNTVFGHRSGKGSWNEGLVVSITLERSDGPLARIELIPICCDQSGCVNVMAPQAGRLCLETLNARSLQTREPGFIEMAWAEFCRDLSYNQLPHALGLGLWLTRVNRLVRGRLVRLLYPRRRQLTALNVIRCAAHREAVQRCYEMSLDTRPRSLKQ